MSIVRAGACVVVRRQAGVTQRLFEQVITLCALAPLLGPGTVRRALRDVGAEPATATIDDYCRAVPRLEVRLRSFLPEDEAILRARSILRLRAQLRSLPSGGFPLFESGSQGRAEGNEPPPPSAARPMQTDAHPARSQEPVSEDGYRDGRQARG